MRNERRSEVLLRLAAPHGMYVQVSLVYHKGDGYWLHFTPVDVAGPGVMTMFHSEDNPKLSVGQGKRFSRQRFDALARGVSMNSAWRPVIARYVADAASLIDCHCG